MTLIVNGFQKCSNSTVSLSSDLAAIFDNIDSLHNVTGYGAKGAGKCLSEGGQVSRGSTALLSRHQTGAQQPPALQQPEPRAAQAGPVLPGAGGRQEGHTAAAQVAQGAEPDSS